MELTDLYQEQDKLVSAFKVDLDREIEAGRTMDEDEMCDFITEWADGVYVYYWDQWAIATACRFSPDSDFGHIFDDARELMGDDSDVDKLMSWCAQMFIEHCLREQFAGYEIVADEDVA
tara:strand:- start:209 stop:565 length:357 start_codon:yes stop_codon:yes gene_type:complete